MGVEIAIGNTRLPVTIAAGVSVDWYRTSFAADASALDFELGGEETAQLALGMLGPDGWERILDLACATGDRTLELCREGFDVIGVDVSANLLEVAGGEAELQDLLPWFYEEDPRYMSFEREFDVVHSLGGGASSTSTPTPRTCAPSSARPAPCAPAGGC